MKPNKPNRYDPSHDAESRKKGPFSIFLFSYVLPPEPTKFNTPRGEHQYMMEKHRERKVIAREWHRNPNRRRSTPCNVLV